MAERRPKDEDAPRSLRIDIPADLWRALKIEAVEFNTPLRYYLQRILEERVPATVRRSLEDRAKAQGIPFPDFLHEMFSRAGASE